MERTQGLRSGYTTGACAAAAARGAALMLAGQDILDEVTITLPGGASATFQLHGQSFGSDSAACYVIKDAGDDPDVTNGIELHARVSRLASPGDLQICGGTGIGRVTKPGLAVPPGQWAINPVPRRMIEEGLQTVFPDNGIMVELSIPDGVERAQKTLNERLGIIGGLSILGTTGIVRPISTKAWTDTLDAALDVARACGTSTVVLSTGRSSEMAAQSYLNSRRGTVATPGGAPGHLPDEAYIMMGDHVAYALQAALKRGFTRPLLACQFAKLLKIACGHANTHAGNSDLDLTELKRWATDERLAAGLTRMIGQANTAREVAVESSFAPQLMELVARHAVRAAERHAGGIEARFLVCGYDGSVAWDSRGSAEGVEQ